MVERILIAVACLVLGVVVVLVQRRAYRAGFDGCKAYSRVAIDAAIAERERAGGPSAMLELPGLTIARQLIGGGR